LLFPLASYDYLSSVTISHVYRTNYACCLVIEQFLPLTCVYLLQGDADIFFPTDFWLLERIDHYCSGWLKLHGDHTSKKGKKRRTITVRQYQMSFASNG